MSTFALYPFKGIVFDGGDFLAHTVLTTLILYYRVRYRRNVIEKKSPNDTFSKIHFFAFSEKGSNSAEFDDRIVQLYSH